MSGCRAAAVALLVGAFGCAPPSAAGKPSPAAGQPAPPPPAPAGAAPGVPAAVKAAAAGAAKEAATAALAGRKAVTPLDDYVRRQDAELAAITATLTADEAERLAHAALVIQRGTERQVANATADLRAMGVKALPALVTLARHKPDLIRLVLDLGRAARPASLFLLGFAHQPDVQQLLYDLDDAATLPLLAEAVHWANVTDLHPGAQPYLGGLHRVLFWKGPAAAAVAPRLGEALKGLSDRAARGDACDLSRAQQPLVYALLSITGKFYDPLTGKPERGAGVPAATREALAVVDQYRPGKVVFYKQENTYHRLRSSLANPPGDDGLVRDPSDVEIGVTDECVRVEGAGFGSGGSWTGPVVIDLDKGDAFLVVANRPGNNYGPLIADPPRVTTGQHPATNDIGERRRMHYGPAVAREAAAAFARAGWAGKAWAEFVALARKADAKAAAAIGEGFASGRYTFSSAMFPGGGKWCMDTDENADAAAVLTDDMFLGNQAFRFAAGGKIEIEDRSETANTLRPWPESWQFEGGRLWVRASDPKGTVLIFGKPKLVKHTGRVYLAFTAAFGRDGHAHLVLEIEDRP